MQKQLANGLILRTLSEGHASDREQLPQFYAAINGEGDPDEAKEALALWTQDLMNNHPLTSHDDIFVVVDPAHDHRLVSATLLIPQTWHYENMTIAVGRPELVATHPDYRKQGLVRQLFAAVHERSAALGHQMQVITGIPYFYRQFGYTMAVALGSDAGVPLTAAPEPAPDHKPAYTLRRATLQDIPDLARWHEAMARERLLSEIRSPDIWRHELVGHHPRSMRARYHLVIENAEGKGVGYIALGHPFDFSILYASAMVIGEEASYAESFEDVVMGVRQWATAEFGKCPAVLVWSAGNQSALHTLANHTTGGHVRNLSYKWYIRVPDTLAFLRHITPVLERRLEGSGAHRYTGELKIGFYDLTGIVLKFERGRIVDYGTLAGKDGYDISFPWHLFWNVVFGDHSVDEIHAILPDVWTGGKHAVLMEALFPKKKSWIDGLA